MKEVRFLAPASKAQQKAVTRYTKNNYDRLEVRTPKGQGEEIKTHAKHNGESMNAFLLRAIRETMQRDVDLMNKKTGDNP